MKIKDNKLFKKSEEIREIIDKKQKLLELSFVEDTHTYYIRTLEGEITSEFPSVSTVIKQFYNDFPALEKSLDMCNGDIFDQDYLLAEWAESANYANSMGSRVHYLLEMDLLEMYGSYKSVRKPIFECNEEQIERGNKMIDAGHDFITLMHRRGAVLLDTEMVLGSANLKYTGQPDKVWIIEHEGELGLIITDWKSNKIKNFQVHSYTEPMLEPFTDMMDTALGHYNIQLPLYARLLLDMLKGTKYEGIKLFGCIIVHLTSEGTYTEYRIPSKIINRILTMPPLPRIESVLLKKKEDIIAEQTRKDTLSKY